MGILWYFGVSTCSGIRKGTASAPAALFFTRVATMSSSRDLLQVLKETLLYRVDVLGGTLDAAMLNGIDPRPSDVFRQILGTGAPYSDIVEFIKGMKELKQGGQAIVSVDALQILMNELWKIEYQVRL